MKILMVLLIVGSAFTTPVSAEVVHSNRVMVVFKKETTCEKAHGILSGMPFMISCNLGDQEKKVAFTADFTGKSFSDAVTGLRKNKEVASVKAL